MSEYISKIAIVGATGNLGTHITNALLKSERKQTITALSRPDSKAVFPPGIHVKKVDYSSVESIAEALSGQDALIITLSFTADDGVQFKLIEGAAKAGVPWIVPNEYGNDNANKELARAVPINEHKEQFRTKIEELGRSSWIGVATNPWFEMAFGMGGFGINIKDRTASFYDDGNTHFNTTLLPTAGQGIAALLALPVKAAAGQPSLSAYRNKFAYIASFRTSQRELLGHVQKATGTKESDWKITSKPVEASIQESWEVLKTDFFAGTLGLLFGNLNKPGFGGDFESIRGLDNEKLGLKKDDLAVEVKALVETPPA